MREGYLRIERSELKGVWGFAPMQKVEVGGGRKERWGEMGFERLVVVVVMVVVVVVEEKSGKEGKGTISGAWKKGRWVVRKGDSNWTSWIDELKAG